MTTREQAQKLFSLQGLSPSLIAGRLDISLNTVKSWKRREKWAEPQCQKTQHKGSAPVGNRNAERHGLYSPILQGDVDIAMNQVKEVNMSSIIQIQLILLDLAILRAFILMEEREKKNYSSFLSALSRAQAQFSRTIKQYAAIKCKAGPAIAGPIQPAALPDAKHGEPNAKIRYLFIYSAAMKKSTALGKERIICIFEASAA